MALIGVFWVVFSTVRISCTHAQNYARMLRKARKARSDAPVPLLTPSRVNILNIYKKFWDILDGLDIFWCNLERVVYLWENVVGWISRPVPIKCFFSPNSLDMGKLRRDTFSGDTFSDAPNWGKMFEIFVMKCLTFLVVHVHAFWCNLQGLELYLKMKGDGWVGL